MFMLVLILILQFFICIDANLMLIYLFLSSFPVASRLILTESRIKLCYAALMKKTKQGPEKQMRARENQRNSVRATKREPERTKEGQKDPERESQRINQ